MRIHDVRPDPVVRFRLYWSSSYDIAFPAVPVDRALSSWRRAVTHWPRVAAHLRQQCHRSVVMPALYLYWDRECAYVWWNATTEEELRMSPRPWTWMWWGPGGLVCPERQAPAWKIPPDVLLWLDRAVPESVLTQRLRRLSHSVRTGWVQKKTNGRWGIDLDADS